MTQLCQHPLRSEIVGEIHSRPYVHIEAPARLSYLAITYDESHTTDHARSVFAALCRSVGAPEPDSESMHHIADVGSVRVRWESHTEFFTLTLTEAGAFGAAFDDPPVNRVDSAWLETLPGHVICASHMALEAQNAPVRGLDEIESMFSKTHLVGAEIVSGGACYWTDFDIHNDGFGRILVRNNGLSARQLGRVARRLMEIDTYRAMAMLAFPIAKAALPTVADSERRLGRIVEQLATDSTSTEGERSLLDQLSELSAEVELSIARTSYRFGAARAYNTLVRRRVEELREDRVQRLQPAGSFLYRRLAPAMATCESVAARQGELARRVGQATDLLRTRVDVALAEQNQKLLESMNRRVKLQLRLQKTVEGLSVVAITYYAISLVLYAAKAAKEAGVLPVAPEVVAGLSLPIIAAVAWGGMRKARRLAEGG